MTKIDYTIDDLITLMERLREPGYGCPWDLAQTYKSIVPSTLEEAYEVVDAIENHDYNQLKEELGDFLFQVIFYSQLGKEQGLFDFQQIVSAITAKLLRRHPHVFPEGTLESRIDLSNRDSAECEATIKAKWEQIKQEEREGKGNHSLLDDIPKALPALVRAVKMQKRAANVGFDWPSVDGIYLKVEEEVRELQQASASGNLENMTEELGDLLFTVINLARHLKIDPETALRKANTKFEHRFREMESYSQSKKMPLEQQSQLTLEQWWQVAKEKLTKC